MSDKNFKVKNGIDAVGPITISPSSNSITGLIINSVSGGTNITFNRNGSQVGYIDEWGGLVTSGGIQVVQPWYTRSPGIEAQSFFWAGSSTRSAAGFGGTYSGTNPVIYISSHSNGTNDLTQWIKQDNTVLAKVDYLGNITANDLTLSGNLTVNGTTTNLNSTNLVIEDKNIILADVATPTDTTANGAGITIKGATDKTLSWIQSTKSFTTSDPFIIDGTNSTTVPLLVKVPTNQTTNSFEIQDNQGYSLFRVTAPAGGTAYNGGIWVRPWGTGNIGAMGTDSYQGFYFVSPSTSSISFGTPGGGRAFEIVVGDTFNRYKIQGSGTGVAPIFTTAGNDTDVNMNIYPKGAGKIGINNASPTGYIHAISSSSSVVGLIVEGATGQTSTNIFEVQRAGGGDASFGVSHNYIDLNRNTTAAASMTIYGANSGAVPLYVKGRASQSVNLTEWQNSSGQVRASIGSTGGLSLNYANGIKLYNAANTDYASLWMDNGSGGVNLYTKLNYPLLIGNMGVDTGAWLTLALSSATQVGQVIRGYTSQSANLQEWQSTGGSVLASIDSAGSLNLASGKQLIFNNGLGTRINFGYGAAYQLGIDDYTIAIEPDNSSNIGKVAVRPSSATYGISYTNPIELYANGQIKQNLTVASNIGLTIKAAASQTASLQEWQNSAGTALVKIDSSGNIQTGSNIQQYTNITSGADVNLQNYYWSSYSGWNTKFTQRWSNNDALGTIDTLFTTSANNVFGAQDKPILYFRTLAWNGTAQTRNFVGVNTDYPKGQLHVNIDTAANKGIIIQAASSQTADLIQWQNSSGTALGYINAEGSIYSANRIVSPGDFEARSNSFFRSPSFNTATINVSTGATTQSGIVIRGLSSQTADLQQWQNNSGTAVAKIASNGELTLKPIPFSGGVSGGIYLGDTSDAWVPGSFKIKVDNGGIPRFGFTAPNASSEALTINGNSVGVQTAAPSSIFQVTGNGAANIVSIIKGATSQTADLMQWRDSSDTVLNTITSSGTLVIGGTNSVNSSFGITMVNKPIANYYTGNNSSYFAALSFTRGNTTGTWMNMGTVGDSSNGVASIDIRDGGNGQLFSVGYTGNTIINLKSTSSTGLIVKAYGNQTANLQEWQDSNGNVAAKVGSDYSISSTAGGFFGTFTSSPQSGTYLAVKAWNAAHVPFIVKGLPAQTGDLTRWLNDAGTVITKVDAAGNITDASNTAWLSPIGSGSDDAPTIQALIDGGKKEIRLGSGQWTFSTRIKVPNGVTIRGTGTSRSSTTGTRVNAVALIASEGTVRDIMFTGAGENSQNELGGGGIAVLGGRVIDCSVTDSRYVLAPTRQPHGYLKNFMSKMQSGYGSVKVAILGDSLSENTSTTSWYGYLFDSTTTATGYYLGSYFGHQIAPSEVDNMAIGGQSAYLLSAQLAMTKETLRTGGYVNQVLDGDNVSTAPFFNRNYNLAILAIGQNGGEDWKAHLEYVVKTIRDKGIDVIILTQNPASGNPTSRAGDEYYYRSMAETYGCLLIDTQAYYRLEVEFGRALGTTADLFGDSVHQSTQGHQLYAKAILNGILDYDSTIAVPANKTVVSRSYIPAQSDRATAIAGINAYYLVKKPDVARDISGVTYTTATDTSIRNPIYGRGTLTSSVTTIASGGYATWGVEYATAAYIIYRENSTTNTLTVSLQGGGSTLATLTTGVTNGRTSVQKVMLSGGYSANRPIRITNTSGDPVQIYGVVFETHADVAFNRNSDGSYPGVKLNGTWSSGYFLDMANYGGLKTPYTSTVNDSVTFKFYGDGLRFATSYGKNSGIIQVKIDDTTYTAVDTYLNIGEYGVYTHFYGGLQYGLHTATITLTGANVSVTGDLGHGARFGLHRISAVRSSWYLTQDQQLAPNSDISANVNFLASPTISSAGGAGAVDLTIKGATTVGSGTTEKLISFKSSANSEIGYVADTGYGATLSQFNYLYTTTVQGWNGVGGAINFANATPITVLPQSSSVTSLVVKGVASQSADLQQWQNSSGTALGKMDANGNFSAISKSFDIEHPTKENMRLRYASLEGPENGVYIRGTAITNIIELPDYWTGLVHEDSITVSLTSVGSAQNIYVEKIENNKVYIGGDLEKAFFTVYGERKDIDKLTVEY